MAIKTVVLEHPERSPHRGKTKVLSGCQFTEGRIEITGGDAEVDNLARYLINMYELVPAAGTVAQVEPNKDEGDGKEAAEKAGDADERLVAALKGLDPANDEHWTEKGLPELAAVEKIVGRPVKRKDVSEALPGLTRAKAKAAAAGEDDEDEGGEE